MSTIKFYTEEQLRKIYDLAFINLDQDGCCIIDEDKYFKQSIKELTPIELPDNDEDAGKIALYISLVRDEEKAVFIIAGAMKYNEWIRSKILNQNNNK